jgi:hypothetical protein
MLVGEKGIVEAKATTAYNTIFEAQVLTYLRLTGHNLGLVINFGERVVKDGLHRVVNGLEDSTQRRKVRNGLEGSTQRRKDAK